MRTEGKAYDETGHLGAASRTRSGPGSVELEHKSGAAGGMT